MKKTKKLKNLLLCSLVLPVLITPLTLISSKRNDTSEKAAVVYANGITTIDDIPNLIKDITLKKDKDIIRFQLNINNFQSNQIKEKNSVFFTFLPEGEKSLKTLESVFVFDNNYYSFNINKKDLPEKFIIKNIQFENIQLTFSDYKLQEVNLVDIKDASDDTRTTIIIGASVASVAIIGLIVLILIRIKKNKQNQLNKV
ncbi:hypothetical protein [Ureaplasma canigenitalium]|uniref:hypothetical protein n=1 Tax=Ureaplasma canigenitalium TaxID=42092 RepID=UPI0004E2835A|nr:hypothetical protein [Ureaplasma canigenitalium]